MKVRYIALGVAVIGGIALAVALWTSSSTPPDTIAGARRALGHARVVHVVASLGVDPNGPTMRPLGSSESMEVWYDSLRHRTHAVLHRGTAVVLDSVEDVLPSYVPPVEDAVPLYAFVSGYRSALAHGEYRPGGSGRIEGRHVIWLTSPESPDLPDVAVDPATYQPLWIGPADPALTQLAVAETKPYDAADFLTAKQRKGRHL